MVHKSVVDDGLTLKMSHMIEGYATNLKPKVSTVIIVIWLKNEQKRYQK